ncbi:MAG: insulinase family protein [Proteobacteria bacterium]|nr:insulinase family protein [Pseudomonadota bacterium]
MKSTIQNPTQLVFTFLLFINFALVPASYAEKLSSDKVCLPSTWPSEVSDLAVDPDLHQGELANGFRYVLKQNKEPKNRVAAFLYVKAGSLNEADNQRGLAHFLEHMMFKGTDNYPAGSLVEYFQSIGMNFGNDANAHTSFDQTVYNLILPNGSEKGLNVGFSVMADYARRATLNDEQINMERGVILAERRSRDSASYRTQVASMEFAFRGTRLAERMVIGVEGILQQADRTSLKTFYDSWYRPENMILIVVGDMEPKIAEQLVERHFSQLSTVGPSPECPGFGELVHKGTETFYHFEPELGKTNVSIESIWDLPLQNDSQQLETEEIIRLMGTMIMGYRLQRLQEEKKAPFTLTSYNSGDILERIGYGTISAQTDAGKWQECLDFIEKTLRQAIEFGFNEQEVERTKKEILAELDSRVLTVKSEDSRKIAQKILRHLGSNRVYQSAEQEQSFYRPIVEQVTTAQVNQEFRALWNHDSRLVSVTGDAPLGEDGPRIIADHYRRVVGDKVVSPLHRQKDKFPYLPLSIPPDTAPERLYYEDIDVERLIFANGLVVNLKKTDYQKNSVKIVASFGAGEQSEPAPGMAILAEDTINISGSAQFPQSAIDALVAGSSVELRFNIGENAFSWIGSSLFKDFELLIQILQTMLYDPGFRDNQFAHVLSKIELMYQKISREIDGAMLLDVHPFLASGNSHFGLPSWNDIAKLDFPALEKWVRSFSLPKDLELSIVGDFNRDDVLEILNKYLGGVTLQSPHIPETQAVYFPSGGTLKVDVETSIDKSLVVVAWPTEDYWDIQRTRRLHVLAKVLEDRLRKVIREKLGAAYSPSVSNFNSRVYQGYGFLIAQVIVKPGGEESIISEILHIVDQLKETGVSADELLRAKRPMLTAITDNIRTNQYWISSVLTLSSRYPEQLQWPQSILSDFSSIDKNDLTQLARQYLDNSRAALARVVPSKISAQTVAKDTVVEKKRGDVLQ